MSPILASADSADSASYVDNWKAEWVSLRRLVTAEEVAAVVALCQLLRR